MEIEIPETQAEWLTGEAEKQNISVSAFLTTVFENYLRSEKDAE